MQTTTNNITTQSELSNYLKSKGVHHYPATVRPNGSFVTVDLCEVPIEYLKSTSQDKFENACNVMLQLINEGLSVIVNNEQTSIFITPKHNIVAENN